jgi:hypothetical protein
MHLSFLLPLFLANNQVDPNKPKLCVNCNNFLPNKTNNKYGKCMYFPYLVDDNDEFEIDKYILSRKQEYKVDFYYCLDTRNSHFMCGNDAKYYEENK